MINDCILNRGLYLDFIDFITISSSVIILFRETVEDDLLSFYNCSFLLVLNYTSKFK
jgi:hypothetical protein